MTHSLSRWLALPLACLGVMPLTAAGASLSPAERSAIIASITQATAQSLKLNATQFQLVPEQLKRHGDWVFMTARLNDAAGRRFDYTGTDLHEAAQAGAISNLCAALLRREGGTWKLLDIAIGPTDLAWEPWPAQHKAPVELFK